MIKLLLLFMLSCFSLFADITLEGSLHPGDEEKANYTPLDPLTNDTENSYDYYTDNPTTFYLSEESDVDGVTLRNATGINSDSNIKVYIDDTLVATGNDGSDTITFDTITLSSGYHTIAVTGSCYGSSSSGGGGRGGGWGGGGTSESEIECSSSDVTNIDDFNFDGLLLSTTASNSALNFITRHHTGDDNGNDDNYNIDDDSYQYYPDDYEAQSIDYTIDNQDELYGFKVLISRMRDIHANGSNKLHVYDANNDLIESFDINHSDQGVFDFEVRYDGNVSGVSKITVESGPLNDGIDDLSFDELIFIPFYTTDFNDLSKPLIEYRMDECSWDNDINSYEISNTGSLVDKNATALGNANTLENGVINRLGDINSTSSDDKAMLIQNNYSLPSSHTITFWVKLPLSTEGHTTFQEGGGRNRTNVQYYNIADRVGSDNDYIYFTYNVDDDSWSLNVKDDSDTNSYSFDPQSYSGWHMMSFVISSSGTLFYFDRDEENDFSTHPDSGELGLLFNSDYSANDNEQNGQSIGALVDEFKLFNSAVSADNIALIYDNEQDGKNYDGTSRDAVNCNGDNNNNTFTYSDFNAVDSLGSDNSCNAVDDWENNITTQISNRSFALYILAKDKNDSLSPTEANITKIVFDYYSDGNESACSGDKIDSYLFCENCGETNSSGCLKKEVTLSRAARCTEVYIEGRDANATEDTNSTSSDDFAIKPYRLVISSSEAVRAGSAFDFNVTAQEYNTTEPTQEYNTTLDLNLTLTQQNNTSASCPAEDADFNISSVTFGNGQSNNSVNFGDVGVVDINITDTEWAKVDKDDTQESCDGTQICLESIYQITITPKHFDITAALYNHNTEKKFTYLSKDFNMSIRLDANITAQNEQNETTKNYNTECYAQNIDINLSHSDVTNDNLTQLLFIVQDANDTNSSQESIDKNDTLTLNYPKENFTTDNNGSTNITLFINFDRNASQTLNPFDMNITEINITDSDSVTGRSSDVNGTVNFYYGRLLNDDITTSQTTASSQSSFLYYCDEASSSFIASDDTAILVNWYKKADHNATEDGNITAALVSDTTTKSATTQNISVTHTDNNVTVSNENNITGTRYIHLDITPWLWYYPEGFGKDYNDTNDTSDCRQHPCIKYTFTNEESGTQVKSGATSALKYDTNLSKVNRGVRLLR